VTTPGLTVRLSTPDRPAATVREQAQRPDQLVTALLRPRQPVRGALRFMDWFDGDYGPSGGIVSDGIGGWSTTAGSLGQVRRTAAGMQLTPRCPPSTDGRTAILRQWHVVAGWPNHSVVMIDWPKG
jgi:hypothetical protein